MAEKVQIGGPGTLKDCWRGLCALCVLHIGFPLPMLVTRLSSAEWKTTSCLDVAITLSACMYPALQLALLVKLAAWRLQNGISHSTFTLAFTVVRRMILYCNPVLLQTLTWHFHELLYTSLAVHVCIITQCILFSNTATHAMSYVALVRAICVWLNVSWTQDFSWLVEVVLLVIILTLISTWWPPGRSEALFLWRASSKNVTAATEDSERPSSFPIPGPGLTPASCAGLTSCLNSNLGSGSPVVFGGSLVPTPAPLQAPLPPLVSVPIQVQELVSASPDVASAGGCAGFESEQNVTAVVPKAAAATPAELGADAEVNVATEAKSGLDPGTGAGTGAGIGKGTEEVGTGAGEGRGGGPNTPPQSRVRKGEAYLRFFNSLANPALIVDLNPNSQAASPSICNPAAEALLQCCENFWDDAKLATTNCALAGFLQKLRKCLQPYRLPRDTLTVRCQSVNESGTLVFTERTFNISAATFDMSDETRMLCLVLLEAPKELEREKRIMENFRNSLVCSLSHELWNPMSSLIPILERMPNHYDPGYRADIKEVALASAELLLSKSKDLVDYSKIELNSFITKPEEFLVDELFEELRRMFRLQMKENENDFQTRVETPGKRELRVMADRGRTKQLLVKLLLNANKYTKRGHIFLRAIESPVNFDVTFSVEDTGMGISKESLQMIFAPLPQKAKLLHEHNRNSTRLPGFGLVLAKSICECMGSSLEATSEKGRGSTFSFVLPIARLYTPPRDLPRCLVEPPPQPARGSVLYNNQGGSPPASSAAPLPSFCSPPSPRHVDLVLSPAHCLKPHYVDDLTPTSRLRLMPRPLSHQQAPLDPTLGLAHPHELNTSEKEKNSRGKDFRSSGEREEEQKESRHIQDNDGKMHDIMRANTVMEEGTALLPTEASRERREKQNLVLITDDDNLVRVAIRGLLHDLHVPAIEASNGAEAVQRVAETLKPESHVRIQLILMDLSMPVMDGIEATREIRDLERQLNLTQKIPIVAVSGHVNPADENACREAGMQDFYEKPLSVKVLHKILTQDLCASS